MKISVNGEAKTLDDGATVADLIRAFDLRPQRVAVEVNERLVRRATFAETVLNEGDRVEIVTLVGGG
jgi:thiamine biosynthesis protein ThiS